MGYEPLLSSASWGRISRNPLNAMKELLEQDLEKFIKWIKEFPEPAELLKDMLEWPPFIEKEEEIKEKYPEIHLVLQIIRKTESEAQQFYYQVSAPTPSNLEVIYNRWSEIYQKAHRRLQQIHP